MTPRTGELRTEFAAWLRQRRDGLTTGRRHDCEAALGLDDGCLAAFAEAPRVVATLPHASPNVFFPRAAVGWYARHLQRCDPTLFHLRVVLTHTNFSDLGWRPYAWWFLNPDRELVRHTLFTRNKKTKHVVVASQPPMDLVPGDATGADREAAELALHGANRAMSYLLLTATVERAAGLALPGRTLYVPLDALVRFALSEATGRWAPWISALLTTSTATRTLLPDGTLAPARRAEDAFVLDNPTNIALLALLSSVDIIGGAKMADYWAQITRRIDFACRTAALDVRPPHFRQLPEVDTRGLVAPAPSLAASLRTAGIGYSQGMALSEHGAFGDGVSPFAQEVSGATR
ncbi:hypothetical protein FHX82_005686 [Amycolatopsis bartoniae]|uniref:Uncharacterized protein n=1 Tax=Amycolatopsis bartoniae TaxID=941986 RepID=A0A8H9J2U2_9PSEU|nr:hypothetical protein [Amycolatopsis bartoniae]MBB2938608.1 hypothetical protein [Amycolatopsis bartoniae]TVT08892.1 hypothetical protein FNH07_10965 [Amycolatopsis bartoniae]GHF69781.1 hypothetical protein GCM10017566_49370 [Amycolatopsis bartoniae]